MGVTGYLGNAGSAPGYEGGQFAANPGGVAVNDATGAIYVLDSDGNRLQRFDSAENFVSAWGADVISSSAAGTGTLSNNSKEVTSLVATSRAFLVGQEITSPGGGIPPGTKITAATTGPSATLILSKEATKNEAGATLTVAEALGNVPQNEKQAVTVTASSGSFTLTSPATEAAAPNVQGYPSATTLSIAYNASPNGGPESVQGRLELLPQLQGGVSVTGAPGSYVIEFVGTRADTNMTQLTVGAGSPPLAGGTATVATLVEGGLAYEICALASQCKPGRPGMAPSTGVPPVPGGTLSFLSTNVNATSPARGIAVNQSTGDVYVTNTGLRRVEQFSASGVFVRAWGRDVVQTGRPGDNPPANAVQTLTVTASSGKYKLKFLGSETAELAAGVAGATSAQVQTALQGLGTIGAGNLTVSGMAGGPYTLTFAGAFASNPEPLIETISGPGEPLVGGTAVVTNTISGSNGFEICNNAEDCKRGAEGQTAGAMNAANHLAIVPIGAPNAGNVVAAGNSRVSEFTSSGSFVRAWGWDVVAAGLDNDTVAPINEFEICKASSFDVCKVAVAGAGSGQFGAGSPAASNRIAADTVGNIYTVESSANFRVQKFAPAGGGGLTPSPFNPSIATLPGESPSSAFSLSGTSAADSPLEVAVDPASNDVYVVKPCTAVHCPGAISSTERRLYEFSASAEALLDTHLANYNLVSVNGLALKAGGEPGYLTSSTPKAGAYVIGQPVPPEAIIEGSTGVTSDSAVLHGIVKPNGGGPLHTAYRFEYSSDGGANWTKAPAVDVDIGSGSVAGLATTCPLPEAEECTVSQLISGLEPNKDYEVRLVAVKAGNAVTSTGGVGDFETDPTGPAAQTFAAFWDTSSDELVLRGGVNPNNSPLTFYFEYGIEPCASSACAVTPVGSGGSGGQLVGVQMRVSALQAGTTYHYRLVADNGVGAPVLAAERTLTTPSAAPCSNQSLREENNSAELSECRAYERVSNGEAWGSGIFGISGAVGDDGNRAQFRAQAFGQPKSEPAYNTIYTASRSASGWSVVGLLPEPDRASGYYSGDSLLTSAALDSALWPESSVGERGRREVQWSLNHLDGTATAAYPWMAPLAWQGQTTRSEGYPLVGGDAVLSTFLFVFDSEQGGNSVKLLPDEALLGEGRSNLYQISGAGTPSSKLELVNRASNPGPGVPGPIIGGRCGAGLGARLNFEEQKTAPATHAVSADGSVIYFTVVPGAPAAGSCDESSGRRIYQRTDGETTVQVSAAQCSPACSGPNGNDIYRGASVDGSTAFFTTPRQLRNSDTDSASDLYLYDSSPPLAQPTLVQASDGTSPGSEAKVLGLADTSADGSRVYFAAEGALTGPNAEGESPIASKPNLYVYERDDANPSGRIVFVGTLDTADSPIWSGTDAFAFPVESGDGDGHFLLFTSRAPLLTEDADAARDLYRYDDVEEELLCLSCGGGGNFDVTISSRSDISASLANEAQRARPANADASAVTFSSKEGLVASDLNGAADVYLWREGSLSLVSAGSGEFGAGNSNISPDGKNVFFVTRAPLVNADGNNALDMYDARVDGGFPAAIVEPPCLSLQECHGSGEAPPSVNSGGSSTFSGTGNPSRKPNCRKGKVRRHGKCVKPKPKVKHKKRAAGRAARYQGGHR